MPEFCLLKCANVLWKQVRFHGLSRELATQTVKLIPELPLDTVKVSSLLTQALQVGLEHELAIYDSVYIAMAQQLNCALITVDAKQAAAATAAGVTLKSLSDFNPESS